jgi:hypothetical protein
MMSMGEIYLILYASKNCFLHLYLQWKYRRVDCHQASNVSTIWVLQIHHTACQYNTEQAI